MIVNCLVSRILFLIGMVFVHTAALAQSTIPESDIYNLNVGDVRVGQVQRFGNPPTSGKARSSIPLVYVSGFELDAESILDDIDESVSIPSDKLNSLSSEDTNRPPFLQWLIESQGFTVYIVQPTDPDASIQTSSEALQIALTDENFELRQHYLASGNPSAVLGWSMGGIIARYALTKMESEGVDHGASLYVSIDAPHRGAFLPTALEMLVRSIADLHDEGTPVKFKGFDISTDDIPNDFIAPLDGFIGKLDSAAARQLLGVYLATSNFSFNFLSGDVSQLQGRYNNISNNSDVSAHPDYYMLRNELLMMGGYPERTRNIGVTHGATDGTKVFPVSDSEGTAAYFVLKGWWNAPGSGGIDKNIVRITLSHDSHNTKSSVCKVKIGGSDLLVDKSFYCPGVNMPDQLAAVVTTSGGTIDALGQLDAYWEAMPDITLGSFLSRNTKIKFSTTGQVSPVTSFIPSLSALDISTGGWWPSVNDKLFLTPFDEIYGNGSRNLSHHTVSSSIANNLVGEFDDSIVHREEIRSAAYAAIF